MFRVPDDWVASGPHDDCIPSTYQQQQRARTGPGRIKDQSFPAMVGGSSHQTRHSTHWLQISVSGYDGVVEPGLDTSVHFTARPASSCTASTGWSVLARPCTSPPPVVQTGGGARRYLSSALRPPQPTTPLSFVTATTICCFC